MTVTQVILAPPPQPGAPAPLPELALTPIAQEIGQGAESGDVDLSAEVVSAGDYANQCVAIPQIANAGNAQNAQGVLQFGSEVDDSSLSGGSIFLTPEVAQECAQATEQAAAAG